MTNEELLAEVLAPESDTLAGDDLIAGPRVITIKAICVEKGQDRPLIINFHGDEGRPFKPCKTTARTLASLWGGDFEKWVGRSVELYRDPDVVYAGKNTGGVRVKAVSDITQRQDVPERLNGKQVKVRKIEPLKVQSPHPEPQKDTPQDAADKLVSNIGRAPSLEKLNDWFAGKPTQTLEKLESNSSDLADKVKAALKAKREAFAELQSQENTFEGAE